MNLQEESNGTTLDGTHFNLERKSRWENFKENVWRENSGVILLCIAQFCNSVMISSTKLLETNTEQRDENIKPLQILLVRMFITYIGCLIYMRVYRDSIPDVYFGAAEVRKWLCMRGVCGFLGVFGSYFSLMYLSISDSVLISFLSPSMTIVLAWIVLRERINRYEIMSCVLSLSGVVLIVKPTFLFGNSQSLNSNDPHSSVESKNPEDRLIATMVALVGTIGMSSVYIIIRFIGKKAHAIMAVSYFSLITLIISILGIAFIPSMKLQLPSTLKEWVLFFNLGFMGFFFQLLLTMGIQRERAGRGSLIQYTQLIYALMWDIILFNHLPSIWSICGMVIIVGSTLYAINKKRQLNQNNENGSDSANDSTVADHDFNMDEEESFEFDNISMAVDNSKMDLKQVYNVTGEAQSAIQLQDFDVGDNTEDKLVHGNEQVDSDVSNTNKQ